MKLLRYGPPGQEKPGILDAQGIAVLGPERVLYKDAEGKIRYAHSLNNTAVAAPRILVSLVENYQQADGSIKIPDVLVPYFGKDKIG